MVQVNQDPWFGLPCVSSDMATSLTLTFETDGFLAYATHVFKSLLEQQPEFFPLKKPQCKNLRWVFQLSQLQVVYRGSAVVISQQSRCGKKSEKRLSDTLSEHVKPEGGGYKQSGFQDFLGELGDPKFLKKKDETLLGMSNSRFWGVSLLYEQTFLFPVVLPWTGLPCSLFKLRPLLFCHIP